MLMLLSIQEEVGKWKYIAGVKLLLIFHNWLESLIQFSRWQKINMKHLLLRSECLFPLKILMLKFSCPRFMILVGEALKGWFGHKGRASWMRLYSFIKGMPLSSPAFSKVSLQWDEGPYPIILQPNFGLSASRTVNNKFYCL